MDLREALIVRPGKKAGLTKRDPAATAGADSKDGAAERLAESLGELARLQYLMYAENRHALLVVLQGMDAAGKDGTIRHVMSGLNPQGTTVTSFKVPTSVEADHDYLWRIHHAVPPKGEIGIFNRSHYEDVLVVRVHDLVPKKTWSRRYDQINDFERMLAENGVAIVKFFLHISPEEQKTRFAARLEEPEKLWKLSPSDFSERVHWDDYLEAYEDALTRCSTEDAPWYVIPADHKWYRNLAVAEIIVATLRDLDMKFPKPTADIGALKKQLRKL